MKDKAIKGSGESIQRGNAKSPKEAFVESCDTLGVAGLGPKLLRTSLDYEQCTILTMCFKVGNILWMCPIVPHFDEVSESWVLPDKSWKYWLLCAIHTMSLVDMFMVSFHRVIIQDIPERISSDYILDRLGVILFTPVLLEVNRFIVTQHAILLDILNQIFKVSRRMRTMNIPLASTLSKFRLVVGLATVFSLVISFLMSLRYDFPGKRPIFDIEAGMEKAFNSIVLNFSFQKEVPVKFQGAVIQKAIGGFKMFLDFFEWYAAFFGDCIIIALGLTIHNVMDSFISFLRTEDVPLSSRNEMNAILLEIRKLCLSVGKAIRKMLIVFLIVKTPYNSIMIRSMVKNFEPFSDTLFILYVLSLWILLMYCAQANSMSHYYRKWLLLKQDETPEARNEPLSTEVFVILNTLKQNQYGLMGGDILTLSPPLLGKAASILVTITIILLQSS